MALCSRGDAWLGRDASTISTPAAGGPVQQAGREIDGRGVRPVEVVEDEDQRLGGRQPFEQLADGPVGPVALVQDSRATAAAEVRQRREDLRELDAHVLVEVGQSSRLDAGEVLVQRVDEDPERQVAFEVGACSAQDDVPARVGAGGELGEQPRLADAGRSDDLDRLRRGGRRARRAPRRAARARGGVLRSGRRARTSMPRARAYVRVGAVLERRLGRRPKYGSRPDVAIGARRRACGHEPSRSSSHRRRPRQRAVVGVLAPPPAGCAPAPLRRRPGAGGRDRDLRRRAALADGPVAGARRRASALAAALRRWRPGRSRRGARVVGRGALGVGVVVGGLALLTAFVPQLPEPSGSHRRRQRDLPLDRRVASRDADAPIPSDHRQVIAQAWYPTDTDEGPPGPLLRGPAPAARARSADCRRSCSPPSARSTPTRRSSTPISTAQRAWPVLVFSPGLGVPREQYTALCTELASRGYRGHRAERPLRVGAHRARRRTRGRPDRAPRRHGSAAAPGASAADRHPRRRRQLRARPARRARARTTGARRWPATSTCVTSGSSGTRWAARPRCRCMAADPRFKVGVNLDGKLFGTQPDARLQSAAAVDAVRRRPDAGVHAAAVIACSPACAPAATW